LYPCQAQKVYPAQKAFPSFFFAAKKNFKQKSFNFLDNHILEPVNCRNIKEEVIKVNLES
jgi:hypothetical protein